MVTFTPDGGRVGAGTDGRGSRSKGQWASSERSAVI
uniref:Uncharacterized protein n=1 Tax=Anguilla anguilla TaxID=7936 RepID=A0A0E9QA75_ANGAN